LLRRTTSIMVSCQP
jgi:hypothetical protein